MKAMTDYELLTQAGNIGFYNSCEITQLFVHEKGSKTNTNLFILAVFEERQFEKTNGKISIALTQRRGL